MIHFIFNKTAVNTTLFEMLTPHFSIYCNIEYCAFYVLMMEAENEKGDLSNFKLSGFGKPENSIT